MRRCPAPFCTIATTVLVFSAVNTLLAVDFRTDVLPVMTKLGCNSGACHGAAIGRGGFRLSLFGQTPEQDYQSIVLELQSRRVNFTDPAQSLLLLKPTGQVEHGGGEIIDSESSPAGILQRWIQEGCHISNDLELSQLIVTPATQTRSIGETASIQVFVKRSDSTKSDITETSILLTQDEGSLEIVDESQGVLRALRPGIHSLIVRYRDLVASAEVVVPFSTPTSSPTNENTIDRFVDRRLSKLGLKPKSRANSSTLVRRLYLSVLGRLPSEGEIDRYQEATATQRGQILNDMLDSKDFSEYWAYWLFQTLRGKTAQGEKDLVAVQTYQSWLQDRIAESNGIDTICRELILAEGDSRTQGATGFYRSAGTAREQAELFAETMLGSRLRCANCHNHPLDLWTQDDYHGLAAVFAGVSHGNIIQWKPGARVIHPRTKEFALSKLPGGPFIDQASDAHRKLAQWMTDFENPFFARHWVNRIWAAIMGKGLISPLDDLRLTNPSTHPELLEVLSDQFVQQQFRLRPLIRNLVSTDAFAREAPEESETTLSTWYGASVERPLAPKVLSTALTFVLNDHKSNAENSSSLTTMQRRQSANPCSAEQGCDPVVGKLPNLSESLQLISGQTLNQRISAPGNRLHQLLSENQSTMTIVRDLYIRALARRSTSAEEAFWKNQLNLNASLQQKVTVLEDLYWSLLTSREFLCNR